MIGVRKSMPRHFRDKYRCTFLKRVSYIIQYESSTTFQNVERFVHLEMSVDRNPSTGHHLLGSQGEIVGACGGANFDENLALITKMNKMFAFGGAEYVSFPCRSLSCDAFRQHLADAETRQTEEEGPAFLLNFIHTLSVDASRPA